MSDRPSPALIALARTTDEPMALLDAEGRVLSHSAALGRAVGLPEGERTSRPIFELAHARDRFALRGALRELVLSGEPRLRRRVDFTGHGGRSATLELSIRNLLLEPEIRALVLTARAPSQLRDAEDLVLSDTLRDRVTGLPNRAGFLDWISRSAGSARLGENLTVLVIAVDRLEVLRGGAGLRTGDDFMVALARRIRASLGPRDVAARLDGDHFAVGLSGVGVDGARNVADRLGASLARPLSVGGREAACSVTFGIADAAGTAPDIEGVLDGAALASKVAKRRRSVAEVFDPEMRVRAEGGLRLETELRLALERDELEVHYQPIVSLGSGELRAFEALVRWRHPERGLLNPGAFLPTAEDADLVTDIGWWVLEHVGGTLRSWMVAGHAVVPVHVNVAAEQVTSGELVARTEQTLLAHDLPAELLHLELTESAALENPEVTTRTLAALVELGVKLSIDDFGTGYSSLSYLNDLPAEVLKIDQSFIACIGPDGENSTLARAILGLAHDLGMRVVAEGIERASTADLLTSLGCDFGQGYLFSRPLPEPDAARMLDVPTASPDVVETEATPS